MPVQDFVQFPYMRRMVEETMLYIAIRLVYTTDYDVFGGQEVSYVEGESYPCGIEPIRISEQPSFTGVASHFDVRIRLPHAAYGVLLQRDRIRVVTDGDAVDYEIVGHIHKSRFSVNLEAARVQA